MKSIMSFSLSVFFLVICLAQPTIEWQKSLGGSNEDKAYSIQQTADGGFIVAGGSKSDDGDVSGHHGAIDYFDYWILRLDPSGDIVWQRSLGGSDDDVAYSVQQTADGGFVIAGYSCSNDGDVSGNHGSPDYWVVKLDSLGIIIWQRSLGGSNPDHGLYISQTEDGGYVLAGHSWSNDGDVSGHHGETGVCDDCWIVKLDSLGYVIWQRSFGGSEDDAAHSIQQTSDGGYIMVGYSCSNDGDVSGHHGSIGYPYYDYWIVKLNPSGDIVWQRSLGGSNRDWANSVQQTIDGGYIIAGMSECNDGDVGGNHGSPDYWVVKLDSFGIILWQKSLGGSSHDVASFIKQTTDGGYIVSGRSCSTDGNITENRGSYDYWLVKLSPEERVIEKFFPKDFAINVSPNPFNSSVAITAPVGAEIEIYDLQGNIVGSGPRPSQDRHRVDLKPALTVGTFVWIPDKSVSSGIYFIRATIGKQVITKRAVLIK